MSNMDEKVMVKLEDIISCENYTKKDETGQTQYIPLLDGISLTVSQGEVLGISSSDSIQTSLLCGIIGNITPYYGGSCILGNFGMMQRKKVVLDHLFYIDSPSMLYDNMNVLEYLMFATSNRELNSIQRQKQLLNFLVSWGLSYISLTLIKNLTDEERLIIQFITAVYSSSSIIVMDLTDYQFPDELIGVLNTILDVAKVQGKAVIIGTMQAKLIGICCDSTTFIVKGKQKYYGTVNGLYERWDRVIYLIKDSNSEEIYKVLSSELPEYDYTLSNGTILVCCKAGHCRDHDSFFQSLANLRIFPDVLKINRGRVQNSFEELLEINDL